MSYQARAVSWLQSGPQSVVLAGYNGSVWFKLLQVFSDNTVTCAPVSTLNLIFPYFYFPNITIVVLHCIKIFNVLILFCMIKEWLFCCGQNCSNCVSLGAEVATPTTSITGCIFSWTCLSRVRFSTTFTAFVECGLGYSWWNCW